MKSIPEQSKISIIKIGVRGIMFLFVTPPTLQEKSKLETDNSVSNPSGNGIPDGLETEFSVFKTLVSNCVHLNSVSN